MRWRGWRGEVISAYGFERSGFDFFQNYIGHAALQGEARDEGNSCVSSAPGVQAWHVRHMIGRSDTSKQREVRRRFEVVLTLREIIPRHGPILIMARRHEKGTRFFSSFFWAWLYKGANPWLFQGLLEEDEDASPTSSTQSSNAVERGMDLRVR